MSKRTFSEANDLSSENRSNSTVGVAGPGLSSESTEFTVQKGNQHADSQDLLGGLAVGNDMQSDDGSSESSNQSRHMVEEDAPVTSTAAPDGANNIAEGDQVNRDTLSAQENHSRDSNASNPASGNRCLLLEELMNPEPNMPQTVDQWVNRYHRHPHPALAELINFILRTSGTTLTIQPSQIKEDIAEEIATEILENGAEDLTEFLLMSKDKQHKRFAKLFPDFWSELISCCQQSVIFDHEFLETLLMWLIPFSSCPFRSLRHTSTIVGMEIAASLTRVLASLKQNLTTKQQQAEVEKKKRTTRRDSTAADDAEDIHQKIVDIENEITTKIFTGIFVHRYRDIVPEIRACSITSLGLWIKNYPFTFLQDNYLKYLGWTLNDKSDYVRLSSIESLRQIFDVEEHASQLDSFSKRFSPRLIEMTLDKSIEVSIVAVKILQTLSKRLDFSTEQMKKVFLLLGEPNTELRSEVGHLIYQNVFEKLISAGKSGKRASQRKGYPTEVDSFKRFLDLLKNYEYAHEQIVSHVDALWDKIPSFRNWDAVVEMLFVEHSDEESHYALGFIKVMCYVMQKLERSNETKMDKKERRKSKGRTEKNSELTKLTVVLLPRLPELISNYQAESSFVVPLLQICEHLTLGDSLSEATQQNVKELFTAIKEVFFANSQLEILQSCAKTMGRIRNLTTSHDGGLTDAVRDVFTQTQSRLRPMASARNELSERRDKDKIYGTGLSAKRLLSLLQHIPADYDKEFIPEVRIILEKFMSGWRLEDETAKNLISCYLLHLLWELQLLCDRGDDLSIVGPDVKEHNQKRSWFLDCVTYALQKMGKPSRLSIFLETADFVSAYSNSDVEELGFSDISDEFFDSVLITFSDEMHDIVQRLSLKSGKNRAQGNEVQMIECQRMLRAMVVPVLVGVFPHSRIAGAVISCIGFNSIQNCKDTMKIIRGFFTHLTQNTGISKEDLLTDSLFAAIERLRQSKNMEVGMQCCFELSEWVTSVLQFTSQPDKLELFVGNIVDRAFATQRTAIFTYCLGPMLSEGCRRSQAIRLRSRISEQIAGTEFESDQDTSSLLDLLLEYTSREDSLFDTAGGAVESSTPRSTRKPTSSSANEAGVAGKSRAIRRMTFGAADDLSSADDNATMTTAHTGHSRPRSTRKRTKRAAREDDSDDPSDERSTRRRGGNGGGDDDRGDGQGSDGDDDGGRDGDNPDEGDDELSSSNDYRPRGRRSVSGTEARRSSRIKKQRSTNAE